MGKLAQSTIKYLIEAEFYAEGIVEKPDVIGAVFGQTEGLLGQDLDLRELQKTGRIGRIDVDIKEDNGKTYGLIQIPSSLDSSETALIAAALETIERIGPCEAKIKLKEVKDIRMVKREYVVDRAKEILQNLMKEQPEANVLTETIKDSVRASEVIEYKGLECGPDIKDTPEIIIVEGRADVVNLLKAGIKNAVAIGGTTIPKTLIEIAEGKKVTAFLDGDRGGDLILKKLSRLIKIDKIVRAPDGKEVEELTSKEIYKALRSSEVKEKSIVKKRPSKIEKQEESTAETHELSSNVKQKIVDILDKMVGTRAAYIFNERMKMMDKIPLNRFNKKNESLKEAKIVLVDGSITEEMAKVADEMKVEYLISESKDKDFETKYTKIYTKQNLIEQ